jgi:RimJ/RimL family protein N-acetyltransferase
MTASLAHPVADKPEGGRLLLRALTLADAGEAYVRWMNDPRVTANLEARFHPQDAASVRAYVASFDGDTRNFPFAMVVKANGRHIGNIKLGNIDWNHLSGDIGLVIGETDCWGQGYATEAISVLTRWGFGTLGLAKIIAGFYAANGGSIAAFRKAGYVEEGRLKDQYVVPGGRTDGVLMGIRREAL